MRPAPSFRLRVAGPDDIAGMHRVRLAVRENRLTSNRVTPADYAPHISETGRGWVVEEDGAIVAFAIGNRISGDIWALFVDPGYEGRGHGRRLHAQMVGWLFDSGLRRLTLSTGSGTRAQRFYEEAGWRRVAHPSDSDAYYELCRAPD